MLLLIRGGSIAAGIGAKCSYVDILRQHFASRDIKIINRSRARETSFQGVWSYDEDIAPYKPDIFLLHFGMDDAFHPVYRSEMKENLVRIIRRVREQCDAHIALATSHTFANIYDTDAVNIYYRTIREVCMDLHCELIAVHTYWAGHLWEHGISHAELLQSDDRLPNEDGHKLYAQAILPHIERLFLPETRQ